MYDEILYEVDDPVAVITMNRPEALNAWTNSMGDEIADAMHFFLREERLVVEGSGAVCAAALLSGKIDLTRAGVIQCDRLRAVHAGPVDLREQCANAAHVVGIVDQHQAPPRAIGGNRAFAADQRA